MQFALPQAKELPPKNSSKTNTIMKSILILFLLVINFIQAQTCTWSKLFDIHSTSGVGGLSQNTIKDNNGNIIVAVVEEDILKLYKLDHLGNVVASLNTNKECGYFSRIEQVSQNDFALVYDNAPTAQQSRFKLVRFSSALNDFQETTLNFPGNSFIKLSSFFVKDNSFYFSVISNSLQRLYCIDENNQLVLRHQSTLATVNYENFSFLNNGNCIIDYKSENNHLIRCISLVTGQLVWENTSVTSGLNTLLLEYKTIVDNNDNIYFAGLERTWVDGQQNDVIKLKSIDHTNGSVIQSNNLIPIGGCAIKVDDFKFNPINNHFYISYRSCFPDPMVVLVELDHNFDPVNQKTFPFTDDILESGQGSSIIIRSNGSLIFTYTKFKNEIENGNLFIVNLSSNLLINSTSDFNIAPKNSSEAFSSFLFYDNSNLLITGIVPDTDPLIWLEKVQYYVAMFEVDALLSVVNPSDGNSISMAPNPVQHSLSIKSQTPIKSTTIYDVLGKKIADINVITDSIDVSNLSQGIYIIKVVGVNDRTIFSKFIKE